MLIFSKFLFHFKVYRYDKVLVETQTSIWQIIQIIDIYSHSKIPYHTFKSNLFLEIFWNSILYKLGLWLIHLLLLYILVVERIILSLTILSDSSKFKIYRIFEIHEIFYFSGESRKQFYIVWNIIIFAI